MNWTELSFISHLLLSNRITVHKYSKKQMQIKTVMKLIPVQCIMYNLTYITFIRNNVQKCKRKKENHRYTGKTPNQTEQN